MPAGWHTRRVRSGPCRAPQAAPTGQAASRGARCEAAAPARTGNPKRRASAFPGRPAALLLAATLGWSACGGASADAPGAASVTPGTSPTTALSHHREHAASGSAGTARHDGHTGHHSAEPDPAGCPEAGHGPRAAPEDLPSARPPLRPEARTALRELAAASRRLRCGAVDRWLDHVRDGSHGAVSAEQPLSGADADLLARQWATAVDALASLSTPEQAAGAGYSQSSSQVPGVGTHWIDWTLVDQPFDPARPSMLLFDERLGQPSRLVGFSYWIRSPTAPDGFAGPNDAWHSHLGLCFIGGRIYLEGVPNALACPGQWLAGDDLWMLHAWVVPEVTNPLGRFAPQNPALCPPKDATVPPAQRCRATGPALATPPAGTSGG